MKILILGGYGTFGGRLAQLLADTPELTLIIAGRSKEKAAAFCHKLSSSAQLIPLSFDRDGDLATQLRQVSPDILVDATGPFQNYGEDPYRVVQACIDQGVHYLDLADGSDFVKGITAFDTQAKDRNVFALSGVSSFPVLTAAVVRQLAQGLQQVRSIKGGIAPSPYAGVGLNVIRAIASYSGKPIALVRHGRVAHGYGLTETMRYTICPPGRLPLKNIRFSLVDVPDLQIIPDDWPQLDSIWMGAGPVPEILHRALNGLAWLVRWRVLPSLLPFAGIFYKAINILRWGEHRGGMFVSVEGITDDGKETERSWHLLAEGDHGPLIPSMAIEAIIRRILDGNAPAFGARPATHDLELHDYEALFAKRTITTGLRNITHQQWAPLYQVMLGDAWSQLPQAVQDMHAWREHRTVHGTAEVARGKTWAAQLAAKYIGFPEAGKDIPVSVTFSLRNGKEVWQRSFAGKKFHSTQSQGRGRNDKLLIERFGPMSFGVALVLDQEKLRLIVRRWKFLGIPLPLCLAPNGEAYEYEQNGVFHFYVEIRHPLTGLIVNYRGSLTSNPEANGLVTL